MHIPNGRERKPAMVTLPKPGRSLGNGDSGVPPISTAPGRTAQPALS